MPTPVYIILAILFLVVAFFINANQRSIKKMQGDPNAVSWIIDSVMKSLDGRISPFLDYTLRLELELNQKDKYQRMIDEGATFIQVRTEIYNDAVQIAQEKVREFKERLGNPFGRTAKELEYDRLMDERERTPRAAIAACFKIPWSQLVEQEYEQGFYVTDTNSGHTWRVPCKEIGTWVEFDDGSKGLMELGGGSTVYTIHEINKNRKPVATHLIAEDDISYALVNNGQFVTEMDKPAPRFFIGTPV